jgi:CRISPR-associated protein Cmr4
MPTTRIYWLQALTPTHAGIGRGVGYIDLPIDRDGVTGWPIIRGSAFKGVWADHFGATKDAREKDPLLKAAFGIADGDNSNSGALIPTDAHLVCLPVRSFRGTFAWATSPLCLQMLRRTLELVVRHG